MKFLLFFCYLWGGQQLYAQDTFQRGNADLTTVLPEMDSVSVDFRKAATNTSFASTVVSFVLSAQPKSPSFSIDFINRKTKEVVVENIEYANSMKMDKTMFGEGKNVRLTPGVNYYFRVKAGKHSFSSPIFTLIVPLAPDVSHIAIDYKNEKLLHLPMGSMWSLNGGSESYVVPRLTSLIPGEHEMPLLAEIRCPSTNTSFESDKKIIEINPRPVLRLNNMNKTLHEGSFVPDITVSIDSLRGSLSLKSSNERIARVQDGYIHLQQEGVCQMTASLEADAYRNHFSAIPVTAELNVLKEDRDIVYRVKNLVVVDGVHEALLIVENSGTMNPALILYDVTGRVVFQTSEYVNNYSMKHLPMGTYYYILSEGTKIVKKGFIELLK